MFSWVLPFINFVQDLSSTDEPPLKQMKVEEGFQLSEQQKQLIKEDTANKKLWDEAMEHLKEGPVCVLLFQDHDLS